MVDSSGRGTLGDDFCRDPDVLPHFSRVVMFNDDTRSAGEESLSQHSELDTPPRDGLADFPYEISLLAVPASPSSEPHNPARYLSAEPLLRAKRPSEPGPGEFETESTYDETIVDSTEVANAAERGTGGHLAAVLAALLVCSIAVSVLWLRDLRSADRELTTLPSSPVLAQALAPAYEAGDTPIIDATDDTPTPAARSMVLAPDDRVSEFPPSLDQPARAGSPVEGATLSRVGSLAIPVEAGTSPRITRPTTLAEGAPSSRTISRTTPRDGAAGTVESSGALAEPLPGAIEAPRTAISEVASSVSDDDRSGIERTLERYQRAYRELDAPAAAALWPTVDARALKRAFASVQKQDLVFRRCDIATTPDAATAHCVGELSYVRRIGDATRRAAHHTWTIRLLRSGKEWSVVGLSAH